MRFTGYCRLSELLEQNEKIPPAPIISQDFGIIPLLAVYCLIRQLIGYDFFAIFRR